MVGNRSQLGSSTAVQATQPAYWPPEALADIDFFKLPKEFRDAFLGVSNPESVDWTFVRSSLFHAGLVKHAQITDSAQGRLDA